jgi:hypothetical protein
MHLVLIVVFIIWLLARPVMEVGEVLRMLRHGRRDVVGRGLPPSCTVQELSIKNVIYCQKNSLKQLNHEGSDIF